MMALYLHAVHLVTTYFHPNIPVVLSNVSINVMRAQSLGQAMYAMPVTFPLHPHAVH